MKRIINQSTAFRVELTDADMISDGHSFTATLKFVEPPERGLKTKMGRACTSLDQWLNDSDHDGVYGTDYEIGWVAAPFSAMVKQTTGESWGPAADILADLVEGRYVLASLNGNVLTLMNGDVDVPLTVTK